MSSNLTEEEKGAVSGRTRVRVFPGRGKKCKGPEVGANLVWPENAKVSSGTEGCCIVMTD